MTSSGRIMTSSSHWLTRYDPDDGEPYGTVCPCSIGDDHDASGVLNGPAPVVVFREESPADEELEALYQEELDNISDGSHTFKELYQHRAALLIALMCQRPEISWWSTLHHDGTMPLRDCIIAGMQLPTGPITYHLREQPWLQVLTDSPVPRLDRAPEYDGHRPANVIDRLTQWATGSGRHE